MRVLVDTSVWSLALRRSSRSHSPAEQRLTALLRELIQEGRVAMAGPIRQEILSGVRDQKTFERLRERLGAFPDEEIGTGEFEEAARCADRCRAVGIAGSAVDHLICAVALRRGLAVLTTDRDFTRYARVLPIRLLEMPGTRGQGFIASRTPGAPPLPRCPGPAGAAFRVPARQHGLFQQ